VKLATIALLSLLLASCVPPTPRTPHDDFVALSLLNMLMNKHQPAPRQQTTTLCRMTDVGLWCDSF